MTPTAQFCGSDLRRATGSVSGALCSRPWAWARYVRFLREELKSASLSAEVSARAVRHCPGSLALRVERLRALEAFVLVGSSRDEYIVPWQSSFFGFYADGEVGTPDANVVLLRDSRGYQEDRLGLRTLDERGALPVLDCRCLHYDFEVLPDPVKVFINGSLLRHLTARW